MIDSWAMLQKNDKEDCILFNVVAICRIRFLYSIFSQFENMSMESNWKLKIFALGLVHLDFNDSCIDLSFLFFFDNNIHKLTKILENQQNSTTRLAAMILIFNLNVLLILLLIPIQIKDY